MLFLKEQDNLHSPFNNFGHSSPSPIPSIINTIKFLRTESKSAYPCYCLQRSLDKIHRFVAASGTNMSNPESDFRPATSAINPFNDTTSNGINNHPESWSVCAEHAPTTPASHSHLTPSTIPSPLPLQLQLQLRAYPPHVLLEEQQRQEHTTTETATRRSLPRKPLSKRSESTRFNPPR